ncbi:MAG: adenylate/guanylate cyclase domain-containing protein [Rhodocyclaceae bacterium]
MASLQRKICVLFAAVSGDSRLYAKLGSAEALYAVERCMSRIERAVAVHGGRVVKVIGDELMAVFDSADAAVQSASEMAQRIDAIPPISGVKLSVRVGFHLGPVTEKDGDVLGETVDIAARLIGLSKAGQMFTSREVVSALPLFLNRASKRIEGVSVKGALGEDLAVFSVQWQESAELSQLGLHVSLPEGLPTLRLRHAGVVVDVERERRAVSFGRDSGSDLIIADRRASRNHARIERRSTHYVLVDQSTNGTYVTFDGELEFALKHEEVPLRNRGRIAFGHSSRDASAEVVEFFISE